MKTLRNISLYYTVFGILSVTNLLTWKLAFFIIIGVVLLAVYFMLHNVFGMEKLPAVTKQTKIIITIFFYLFPFILAYSIYTYADRPYKQVLILPDGYTGLVVVQYGKKEGQPKKWTGGFLGIGASRLIKVNDSGYAATQFTYHSNAFPLLNVNQHYEQKGLKVSYKRQPIPVNGLGKGYYFEKRWEEPEQEYQKRMNTVQCFPDLGSSEEFLILVITKPIDFHKYFEEEGLGYGLREEYLEKIRNIEK